MAVVAGVVFFAVIPVLTMAVTMSSSGPSIGTVERLANSEIGPGLFPGLFDPKPRLLLCFVRFSCTTQKDGIAKTLHFQRLYRSER
jgi:hypothetical protein